MTTIETHAEKHMARSIRRLRYAIYRTTSWGVGIRLHLGWGFINAPLLTFTYRVA